MDLFVVIVGVLVFVSVSSLAWYVTSRSSADQSSTRRRAGAAEPSGDEMPLRVLRDTGGRLPFVNRLPLSREARARMELELEQAGQPLRVNEYLAIRVGGALLLGIAALVVLSVLGAPTWLRLIVPLGAMTPGWMFPRMLVSRARQRRQREFEKQLPDALTAIAKSLRAGTGLLQALAYAGDETPTPLGPELQSALRDLQLRRGPRHCVHDALAARWWRGHRHCHDGDPDPAQRGRQPCGDSFECDQHYPGARSIAGRDPRAHSKATAHRETSSPCCRYSQQPCSLGSTRSSADFCLIPQPVRSRW